MNRARIPAENGLAISLSWGDGTHSDNYDSLMHPEIEYIDEPSTVEIAFFREEDTFVGLDLGDQVYGYVPVASIWPIYTWMSQLSSKSTQVPLSEVIDRLINDEAPST